MNEGDFPEPPDIRIVMEHYGYRANRKMVLCPFHEDTVASFSMDFNRGLYKCHACGETGNTWTLIMRKEGMTFGEARDFAASVEWTAKGSDGNGGTEVFGSTYGGGRKVSHRQRNHKGNRKYVPSWRRRGS